MKRERITCGPRAHSPMLKGFMKNSMIDRSRSASSRVKRRLCLLLHVAWLSEMLSPLATCALPERRGPARRVRAIVGFPAVSATWGIVRVCNEFVWPLRIDMFSSLCGGLGT
eukprot:TRINITY_DN48299_c0_g1_i1.p1 TRINITY_DN48299_c0_g1~~TRINITY_DN48299_c0_g1_i1.p1  ORF type:complete len:112 (-),score=9.04 TRINITY_DN48299_c0_g1_i1:123-458(-)